MREQRRNERTPGPALTVHERDLTVEQARAMRDDQARLAAYYAVRAERARVAGVYGAMRCWLHEYRRAVLQCRLLGERIRRGQKVPEETGANRPSVVGRLAPRPDAHIASAAGEAA